MADRIEQVNWAGGINNLTRGERVPEGCVRDALNVTPTNGGTFALRPGVERLAEGERIRGMLSLGRDLIYADGARLMRLDTATGTESQLATIPPVGVFTGAVLNGELFISTETSCLRYHDGAVREWGAPEARFNVAAVGGSLPAGRYQVACVHVNARGEESGVLSPAIIDLGGQQSLAISCTPAPGHRVRVYASVANGQTLYLQGELPSAAQLYSVRDDTARLQGMGELPPVPCQFIVQVAGTLACASGKLLWLTQPMRPHVRSALGRFFQFSKPVGLLLKVGQSLFVSADRTYFISGIEGNQPVQREALPYPAITGTGVLLSDGRAAWMTQYGLAVGAEDGSVALLSKERFAPSCGTFGASGQLDHDGNQIVVTAMRGPREASGLVARDYYEVEIEP